MYIKCNPNSPISTHKEGNCDMATHLGPFMASRQFSLRIPDDLYETIVRQAEEEKPFSNKSHHHFTRAYRYTWNSKLETEAQWK